MWKLCSVLRSAQIWIQLSIFGINPTETWARGMFYSTTSNTSLRFSVSNGMMPQCWASDFKASALQYQKARRRHVENAITVNGGDDIQNSPINCEWNFTTILVIWIVAIFYVSIMSSNLILHNKSNHLRRYVIGSTQ